MEKQLEIMNQNLERIAIALEAVQEEWKAARKERAAEKMRQEQQEYVKALEIFNRHSSRNLHRNVTSGC